MNLIEAVFFLTSVYPVARAWFSNRATTMIHALSWAAAAWLSWFGAILLAGSTGESSMGYLALCMTGCAGVAVLGARRPIAGAWNFVVLGLLAVLLLPLAENAMLSTPLLDPLRLLFACGTVALTVFNYLPTRFGVAALTVGAACLIELLSLRGWPEDADTRLMAVHVCHFLIPLACWSAWLAGRRNWAGVAVFDREWLMFRDRFGLMWSQRVRDQFNRAAKNAGWPVILRWRGLRRTSRDLALPNSDQTAIVITLRDLLKRFGVADSLVTNRNANTQHSSSD